MFIELNTHGDKTFKIQLSGFQILTICIINKLLKSKCSKKKVLARIFDKDCHFAQYLRFS